MLITPLGHIKLYVNDNEVPFVAKKLENNHQCPDVSGRFIIEYPFKKEYKSQIIKCCIPLLHENGKIESGERLEAITFYKDKLKMTIAVEAAFEQFKMDDYSGHYTNNGIAYETLDSTMDRTFQFGVCWIDPCTPENEHQTWFGADPSINERD